MFNQSNTYRCSAKYYLWLVFMLVNFTAFTQNTYRLEIHPSGKDTLSANNAGVEALNLRTSFRGKPETIEYIYQLPQILATKGFPVASVDTVYFDSLVTHIHLFTGPQYKWVILSADSIEEKALGSIGWSSRDYLNKPVDFSMIARQKQSLLRYYEKNGFPFSSVSLDDISIDGDSMRARLSVSKGPLYKVDSIRVYGKLKIKNLFLQKYVGIPNGSIYNIVTLEQVSKRLLELPYLVEEKPWDLTMLGTGSILNLYLAAKRSSQVNFLIGFLPSRGVSGKSQLTADVNLNLKNALSAGETILLKWQQLQKKSPRLNAGYNHPYIFNSQFGIDLRFDLLKRDTTYLFINAHAGIQYLLSANQSGRVFLQNQRSYLLEGGFDTNQIRISKRLPPNIDVSSTNIGLDYEWRNTDYLYNPRKGNELKLTGAFGVKKINRNNDITNLKDPANPAFKFSSLYDSLKLRSYQLRLVLSAAHYFPSGKRSVLKAAVTGGLFSSDNIFRNELFQIGGYALLRGFDEESIFATTYAVITAEYRNLISLNSYLYTFIDAGITKTRYQVVNFGNNFIGAGIGGSLETKFGVMNLSFAAGNRDDIKFDIRNALKIHFGYINYF